MTRWRALTLGLMAALALTHCGDDDDDGRDASTRDASIRDADTRDANAFDADTRDASLFDAARTDAAHADASDDAGSDDDAGETRCPDVDLCESGIELPASQHYVRPGMCVRAIALRQGRLRQLTFAPNGDLFGITVDGQIYRYRDLDCDGSFDDSERTLWASTGGNGNNVHIIAGHLYAGVMNGVRRWSYNASADVGGQSQLVVSNVPTNGRHTLLTVHVYDGFLYVQSGSKDNASSADSPEYDDDRALLKRFPLADFDPSTPFAWNSGEVYATGLRNTVGFTQHLGEIYGVVNGIDDLYYEGEDIHEENPGDMVTRIVENGTYGYPFCFSALHVRGPGDVLFPAGTQLHTEQAPGMFDNPHDDAWCALHSLRPETLVDAHAAPLDITFLERATPHLLDPWVGGAFVTLHGSWNRGSSTGHKVIWIPFDALGRADMPVATENGPVFDYQVVFGGGNQNEDMDGAWTWNNGSDGEAGVRPVGVAISPDDGALYVSSDNAPIPGMPAGDPPQGAIYRIARRP